jgi:hypothetical protein
VLEHKSKRHNEKKWLGYVGADLKRFGVCSQEIKTNKVYRVKFKG